MSDEIIVFEELSHSHRWITRWYSFRKKQVYFLRLNKNAKQKKWICDYCARGRLKKLELNFKSLGIWEGMYPDEAFNNLGKIFPQVRGKRIVKAMAKLYQTDSIELAYKMVMHTSLTRFFYIVYAWEKILEIFPKKKLVFVPTDGVETFRSNGCEVSEFRNFYQMFKREGILLFDSQKARFASWAIFTNQWRYALRMLKFSIMLLAFPFWAVFKSLFNIMKNLPPLKRSRYPYAFHVFSIPHAVDNRMPKFDFLIDRDQIKDSESLFISYSGLYGRVKEYLGSKNVEYCDDLNRFINIRDLGDTISAYFSLMTSFLRDGYFIALASLKLIYFYLRWSGFSKAVSVSKLISFCDYGIESVARNLILANNGTQSYCYMDSSNFGCFYSNSESRNNYRGGIGYITYDYFISWNDRASDYLKESKCHIKQYINTGCLLSESIRLIKEGKWPSDFKDKLTHFGFKDDMRLVSVFDSTLSDDSISDYAEGIKFLEDVLRLLSDHPEIFVVLKEKKSRLRHPNMTENSDKVIGLYESIHNHPRAICVMHEFNTSEIISCSDLTISFPFTSSTFEAIAARGRALWHDAQNKYRDTYYDEIPGLICHNYDELSTRVNQLLNLESDEQYSRYLDFHIKGKVESFLDGNAITRFKQCLLDDASTEDFQLADVSMRGLENSKL